MNKTILIDMDGTICSFVDYVLGLYNLEYHDNLTAEDITYEGMHECVKPECGRKIYNYFHAKGTFANLPIIPGASEAIHTLLDKGHEIFFVTKPVDHSQWCLWEKQSWVDEYFPTIGHKKVIFTGQKHMVRGDVLIDDLPTNLIPFRGRRILVDQPWNQQEAWQDQQLGLERYFDWKSILVNLS